MYDGYIQTRHGWSWYCVGNEDSFGVPVLVLHGGPGGSCNPELYKLLDFGHPIYTYDQLGCGMSSDAEDRDGYSLQIYVEELEDVIEGMGLHKFILMGASWGASLAVSYALEHGTENLKGLILVSPYLSGKLWNADQEKNIDELPSDTQKILRAGGTSPEFYSALYDYYKRYLSVTGQCDIPGSSPENGIPDPYRVMWGTSELKCEGTMAGYDVTDKLCRIDTPACLMCGDSDEVRTETLAYLASLFQDSEQQSVPRAGHRVRADNPEGYRGVLKSFIAHLSD